MSYLCMKNTGFFIQVSIMEIQKGRKDFKPCKQMQRLRYNLFPVIFHVRLIWFREANFISALKLIRFDPLQCQRLSNSIQIAIAISQGTIAIDFQIIFRIAIFIIQQDSHENVRISQHRIWKFKFPISNYKLSISYSHLWKNWTDCGYFHSYYLKIQIYF